MNSKDNKVKVFIKKHSNKIIGGAILISGFVISGYIHRDGFIKGFSKGHSIGFEDTVQWCEKNIEDIQLIDKVNTWAQENPEKWCGGQIKKEEA